MTSAKHDRCWRIDRVRVAGTDEYRYRCRDCGHVYTAIEARRLGDSGPIDLRVLS